jgi:hypothetical protein
VTDQRWRSSWGRLPSQPCRRIICGCRRNVCSLKKNIERLCVTYIKSCGGDGLDSVVESNICRRIPRRIVNAEIRCEELRPSDFATGPAARFRLPTFQVIEFSARKQELRISSTIQAWTRSQWNGEYASRETCSDAKLQDGELLMSNTMNYVAGERNSWSTFGA